MSFKSIEQTSEPDLSEHEEEVVPFDDVLRQLLIAKPEHGKPKHEPAPELPNLQKVLTKDTAMAKQREITLWPSRENYFRFRAVCDDEIPETFEEFEMLANSRMIHLQNTHSILIEKITFDPDKMAAWCRAQFGKVDSNARRHYAATIALSD